MKIGDRDTPGTRIYAEKEFRDEAQVLVATEAAGEGINLQFCWFMINYDIPWNPVRLEQRMGRIHRYGQEKDCLIRNFVSTNTREGRVLQKLFQRLKAIEEDLDPHHTGKIFNVLGDIFPANQLERMVRDMYAHNLTEDAIKNRIVENVDVGRFRQITDSTLEGLAKRELNLSALIGKSAEARERRLVPEVVEDFFVQAAPLAGLHPKLIGSPRPVGEGPGVKASDHVYRLGKIPRTLQPIGDRLEPRFGKLGREYRQIVFDKAQLAKDATSEWVTPGHPLFEAVREDLSERVRDDLRRGAVFYDLHCKAPSRLDVFMAAIKDGRGNYLHRKLFVVQTGMDLAMTVREPTIFLDLVLAPKGTEVPCGDGLRDRQASELVLVEKALNPLLAQVAAERLRETQTISRHLELSLNTLIDRQNFRMAALFEQSQTNPNLFEANKKQIEDRLDELNGRLERRRDELQQQRQCTIGDIQHLGPAWVLPHPERTSPGIAPMVRDDEIEHAAVAAARRLRGGPRLAGRERRRSEPWLRSDLPQAAPRRPADLYRRPVHRGQGPGHRRRDRPDEQRVQDRRPAQAGLLALRRVQLRLDAGGASDPGPG